MYRYQYRVSKYDPELRDSAGKFTGHEWTSFSDIGKKFGDEILTPNDYQRIEEAYIRSSLEFLSESSVPNLVARGVENRGDFSEPPGEGKLLAIASLPEVLRGVLREEYWCRFENDRAFIHVGYDFYMYVGVPDPCVSVQLLARELGLYVEPFKSPYLVTRSE